MPRKRYKAEEIVSKLRQVDVSVAGTKRQRRHSPDRRDGGDLLPLAAGAWWPDE